VHHLTAQGREVQPTLYCGIVSTFGEDELHTAKILCTKEANFNVHGHVNRCKSGIGSCNNLHAVIGKPQRNGQSYVQCTAFCVFPEKNLTFISSRQYSV
jgi:hypothetical protein